MVPQKGRKLKATADFYSNPNPISRGFLGGAFILAGEIRLVAPFSAIVKAAC
jgi:hypothetical protein